VAVGGVLEPLVKGPVTNDIEKVAVGTKVKPGKIPAQQSSYSDLF
jgi:hypothetical protein